MLILPIVYSPYILSFKVLKKLPRVFKKGGIASALERPLQEGHWLARVCESLKRTIEASTEEWAWLFTNLKIDLDTMQYRLRYLTALQERFFSY